MDYVTRQFINLAKKFRKELRLYVFTLDSALHKQTEAISKTQQACDKKQSPPPEVTVLNNLPASIEVHHNEKDTSDERNYRRFTFLVTGLTLGAITVYAVLVFWQYREMIKATSAAEHAANNAAKQTEALMDGQSAQVILDFDFDGFLENRKGNVSISNQGPSVATYVRTPSTGLSPKRWPPHHPLIAYPRWDQVAADQASLDKQCMENLPIGIPIRPQSKPIVIQELREPTDTEVVNGLLSYGELYVTCYRDIFGRPHHSDLCLFWNGKIRQFQSCQSGQ